MTRPFNAAMLGLLALLTLAPAARADTSAEPAPFKRRVYLIGPLRLSHPHYKVPDGSDGPVGYLEIQNRGSAAEQLVSATIQGAASTEVIGTDGGNGTLMIPPRATVILGLSGARLVAHGWADPKTADGRLATTLRFARAGDIQVSLGQDDSPDPDPAAVIPDEKPADLSR